MKVFTKKWFYTAGIRMIKAAAQTAIATIGTAAVLGDVDWLSVLSASALAGLLSIMASIAYLPDANEDE